MLDAPARGCINIHASLLPRWRGAAPIHAALMAGDEQTGITITRMEEGLDTGPMLLAQAVPIAPDATVGALHDTLAELGAQMILRALAENPPAIPQPDDGVTYAPKLTKADGRLDWAQPAAALDRRVRALNPWPGTYFDHAGEQLRVLAAREEPGAGAPGTLLDDAALVATGAGALRLLRLQRPGRAPQDADAFLRGFPLPRGAVLA
jgi:methionyl-tRNA formyltransferase